MAVSGQIGQESVILDNAATEETLKLLLQATLATTKAQKDAISQMAQKAGLDPAKVSALNTTFGKTGEQLSGFNKVVMGVSGGIGALGSQAVKLQQNFGFLTGTVEQLTAGSAKTSNIFNTLSARFSGLHPVLGLVLTGFSKLAKCRVFR